LAGKGMVLDDGSDGFLDTDGGCVVTQSRRFRNAPIDGMAVGWDEIRASWENFAKISRLIGRSNDDECKLNVAVVGHSRFSEFKSS
jgi:hypothetical protein